MLGFPLVPEQYTPQTKGELLEVHAILFLDSPDFSFKLPDIPDRLQRTLVSTVQELHRGVDYVYRKERCTEAREKMHAVIDAAFLAFKENRVHDGRMICHQIEDLIRDTKP
jgi:hypothetical protein